ncbi:MAG: hypothetical protein A2Z88_11735 [Omnitrophica WOR_2 bacterium GWA2_47_8]|nr:MAG: hypothetical protein A2Z88_11735 [Omnitrophica WOR_2 bacterium GWA2_47_8]
MLAEIPWDTVVKDCTVSIALQQNPVRVTSTTISISEDGKSVVANRGVSIRGDGIGFECTPGMIADALADSIPNPWLAYEIAEREWKKLVTKHGEKAVNKNADLILEALQKKAADLLEAHARAVFEEKVGKGEVNLLVAQKSGWTFPTTRDVATRHSQSYNLNLFERVADGDLNGLEGNVAEFLEGQEKLYFWYRNMARKDYVVQGWRREKIYADFILALRDDRKVGTVYVLETKGEHLAGNLDTKYKRDVFELCTKFARKASVKKLKAVVGASDIEYKLVTESDWRNKLAAIFR